MTGLKNSTIVLLGRIDEHIDDLKNHLTEELKLFEVIHANNPVLLDISKDNTVYGT